MSEVDAVEGADRDDPRQRLEGLQHAAWPLAHAALSTTFSGRQAPARLVRLADAEPVAGEVVDPTVAARLQSAGIDLALTPPLARRRIEQQRRPGFDDAVWMDRQFRPGLG